MNKKRNFQLDAMKGIGILLVLIGHISHNKGLNTWIYSFHMPLFFFISGIIYCISNKVDSKNYFTKKFKSLMIPYFTFSFMTFVYWFLIERHIRDTTVSAIHQFYQIFISQGGDRNHEYNVVLWFLPCLFVMEILFDYLNKNLRNKKHVVLALIVCSFLGYILTQYNAVRLPFSIDTMLVAIPFYGLGFFMTNHLESINSFFHKYRFISMPIFVISSLLVAIYYGGTNLNNNEYANYFLFYILALSGIGLVTFISNYIKNNKFFLFLGMNSLILMCIHEPLKRILLILISKVIRIEVDILRYNILLILFVTLVMLIVMWPLITIVNRYFTFMLGKTVNIKKLNIIKD